MFTLHPYASSDLPEMIQLFYDTVHTINAKDYTPQQLQAWADGQVDQKAWNRSFLNHTTWVAKGEDGAVVGFGDMDATGYLDRLYVHWNHQGEGIGSALCDMLERTVGPGAVVTHASITARPFFQRRGYLTLWEQQVVRHGVALTNYVLRRPGQGEHRPEVWTALFPLLKAFAQSGWEQLETPARRYLLEGSGLQELVKAVEGAVETCGTCGCHLDRIYPQFLALTRPLIRDAVQY